ncbi:MAG: DNA resolvase, partial [Alistipes sp.]|nr:DNA resolvase [Alistipes sp.]
IKERMASGRRQYIEKCRRDGIKMGRPSTYRKSDEEYRKQYQKEISLIRKGLSLANISAITGTSINTIRRVKEVVISKC